VLGNLSRDDRHLYQTPHKYVLVAPEEVDELAFIFRVQAGPDLNGFGSVFSVDLHGLGILGRFESVGRGGHGLAERHRWYSEAQLSQFGHDDRSDDQLNAVQFVVQHSLSLGLHSDNPGGPGYLELEVGVAGDGHELDITQPT
jgi:hypothetical protein